MVNIFFSVELFKWHRLSNFPNRLVDVEERPATCAGRVRQNKPFQNKNITKNVVDLDQVFARVRNAAAPVVEAAGRIMYLNAIDVFREEDGIEHCSFNWVQFGWF